MGEKYESLKRVDDLWGVLHGYVNLARTKGLDPMYKPAAEAALDQLRKELDKYEKVFKIGRNPDNG